MKIAVICPTGDELRPYLDSISASSATMKAGMRFLEGSLEGKDVIAVECGVCKVNAALSAQIAIDGFGAGCVIISGVAGGMAPELKVCDTVVSTSSVYHDVLGHFLTKYHPYFDSGEFEADSRLIACCKFGVEEAGISGVRFGRIATGEAFIEQDGRDEIIKRLNPLCIDMETAAVAHVCSLNGIPYMAVRSISDTEKESGIGVFEENCARAAHKSFDVVCASLKYI